MSQIVAVRHLQCKHNASEWRAKNSGHACRRTADQHDSPIAIIQTQFAKFCPQPRPYRRATVNTGAFQRGAAAKPHCGDSSQQLGYEGPHIDLAFVLVIGTDDLFRGMAVRVRRRELHDESRHDEAYYQSRHDGPMVMKIIGEHGRP